MPAQQPASAPPPMRGPARGPVGPAGESRAAPGDVTMQNRRGEWVPAIPLPFFLSFGRVRCDCRRRFRNVEAYRGHYALVHILALS